VWRIFCTNNQLTGQFEALSFCRMEREEYLRGIASLYAAEVLGEGLASRWLELCSEREQKYKLSLFLQLESEAKVRLRPLLARYNLSLVEDQGQRAGGDACASLRRIRALILRPANSERRDQRATLST
jgi:hypothetical protein